MVSSTDRRGAETAAVDLCAVLEQFGLDGRVVALAAGTAGGLDVPVLGPSRFSPRTVHSLRRSAARSDLVIAHGSSTLPATAAATFRTGTPFVYRSIGDPGAWVTTPARRLRVRAAVSRAGGLVALWSRSAVIWHSRLGVPAERIVVIPNGVDTERFTPPTREERAAARRAWSLPLTDPVVMYLGALSPEKRVDRAIRAVAAMDGPTLAIVGSGPEQQSLAELAASVPDGRIRMLGPTDQPALVLAAADVLIIPSATEGQPAAAIEAGMCGLPVVASRVGGLPEIILDGQTGILTDRGDERQLVEGLERCIAQRDQFGQLARHHCERHFALSGVAGQWANFLQYAVNA